MSCQNNSLRFLVCLRVGSSQQTKSTKMNLIGSKQHQLTIQVYIVSLRTKIK